MRAQPKFLLLLTVLGIVPVVALGVINYRNGVRAVEELLRSDLQREAMEISRDVAGRLKQRESAIIALARSPSLRAYVLKQIRVRDAAEATSDHPALRKSSAPPDNVSPIVSGAPSGEVVPEDIQAEVRAFLQSGEKYYFAVACLGPRRQPLFRAELNSGSDTQPVRFQTRDFLSTSVRADERVWSSSDDAPLRSIVTRESLSTGLRYTIPIQTIPALVRPENATQDHGALLVDVKLDSLIDDSTGDAQALSRAPEAELPFSPRLVIMLDPTGNVVYHSNAALRYQPATNVMPPSFAPIAEAMNGRRVGWQFFKSSEGNEWIAAFQPVPPLDLSVAVAGDYSLAVHNLRFWGWTTAGLITLVWLTTGVMLLLFLRRRALSIDRITEGAVAIAGGKLDERIDVRSSDEIRLLAETFNAMGDRLREQIALEAETRQFESFMRLSAMLTHDLKNAIQALSLIVGNMEQQFHREEFRADAMQSLRDATSQLSALVAKLSEPVRSLSGEFKRPRRLDVVPAIKRALTRTAEPAAAMHQIEIQLPSSLAAIADDERIEKVVENLVLNALEAMGTEKGRLSVTAGPAEEGFVSFSVCDTGPGMTEEFQRTRLFRPFATTKPKGIGLGLYTCNELVRALGGRIEVESERGSGTCIRIVLPSGAITEESRKSSRAE